MLTEQAVDAFTTLTGSSPAGVWTAPGRINLIGEHTDYNDGYVLPFALPHAAYIAASPRSDGRWRFRSVDLDDTVELGADELVPGSPGWQSYLAGVVWALREAGHDVEVLADFTGTMGHAGAVVRRPDGVFEGASDPRADGAALGW